MQCLVWREIQWYFNQLSWLDPADTVCTAAMYFATQLLRHPGMSYPDETEFQVNSGYSLFNNRLHSYWPAIGPYSCVFTHFKPPLLNSRWNTKLSPPDKIQSRILSCQNPFYNIYIVCFKMPTCCAYTFLQIPINNISVMLFFVSWKVVGGIHTHTHKKYVQAYKSITILDVCFFSSFFCLVLSWTRLPVRC